MLKLILVVCAVIGAYIIAQSFFHLSSMASLIVAAVVCVIGFSGKD